MPDHAERDEFGFGTHLAWIRLTFLGIGVSLFAGQTGESHNEDRR